MEASAGKQNNSNGNQTLKSKTHEDGGLGESGQQYLMQTNTQVLHPD